MEARSDENRKRRGLIGHCGDFLRWLLLLALVTAAVCSFGLYFIHSRLDEEIRLYVQNKFQSHYTGLIVRVRSAHRVEGRGIEIRGILLSEPTNDGRALPLVYVEELFAECPTELADLVAGHTQSTRIIVRGAKLQVIRLPGDRWNAAQLFPPPKFGDTPPPITIEDSTIDILDLTGTSKRLLTLHEVGFQITPLSVASVSKALGTAPVYRIDGIFGGDHVRHVRVRGNITPAEGVFDLAGNVQGLEVSPDTIDALPEDFAQLAAPLRSATGLAGFTFACDRENATSVPHYALVGDFKGRIEDPRLPQPLMNVKLPFQLSDNHILIQHASARAGPTKLQFAAQGRKLAPGSPYSLKLKAEHVVLDEQLAASLSTKWRGVWDKFAPRGVLDADLTLQFDGERFHSSIVADLLDTSFAYYKLPYRAHNARGQIRYQDDLLEIDQLLASANGVPVLIDGKLYQPGPQATGWVEVRLDQPLPIDDQLIQALPPSTRRVVNALNPQHGKFTGSYRLERPNLQTPQRRVFEIKLSECSMEYERFPYPLYGISGTLRMDNDVWTFSDLEGHNDNAVVMCQGGWRKLDESNSLLGLSFDAFEVPLEDELRDALPPGAQRFWRSLRPRGSLDHLDIDVRYQSMAKDLSVTINGLKRRSKERLAERVTIKPTWLPYQLDDVVGIVRYDNGVAELENVQGHHGNTSVQLSGRFDPLPDDKWQLRVRDLHIDRLRTDHELVPALPEPLARAVTRLNLSGPLHVSGSLAMQGNMGVERPTAANWDLDFDVEDGMLDFGVKLDHLRGSMKLAGSIGSRGHYSRGQLEIDSLVYQGLQLTNVTGPLSIDDEHLALGEAIRRQQGELVSRPLKANLLGGVLVGSGQISLGKESSFELDGELFDADLTTVSKEFAPGKANASGRAFAQVRLTGTGTGTHNLRGHGAVQLRDADIYQLPVMVRLLKIVRVKRPDETAFTTSDMAFTIEGDRLYFKQIDFSGDAINLRGRGEMTFDRAIDVVFQTSVLVRDGPVDRLLRPVLRDAAGLFEVQVTGTLDEPQVTRGVNQAIQQVFPETERRVFPDAAGRRENISRLPQLRSMINRSERRQ